MTDRRTDIGSTHSIYCTSMASRGKNIRRRVHAVICSLVRNGDVLDSQLAISINQSINQSISQSVSRSVSQKFLKWSKQYKLLLDSLSVIIILLVLIIMSYFFSLPGAYNRLCSELTTLRSGFTNAGELYCRLVNRLYATAVG